MPRHPVPLFVPVSGERAPAAVAGRRALARPGSQPPHAEQDHPGEREAGPDQCMRDHTRHRSRRCRGSASRSERRSDEDRRDDQRQHSDSNEGVHRPRNTLSSNSSAADYPGASTSFHLVKRRSRNRFITTRNAKGPRIAPGPFAASVDQMSMRVKRLSAPYWKTPMVASVGSPCSSKVIGPEKPS